MPADPPSAAVRFEDIELGDELPEEHPDVSLDKVRLFVEAARIVAARFLDDEEAKKQGLPGAIVPGMMSQGILAAMIHRWAPGAQIVKLDTVFRSPVLVGSAPHCTGAVTDTDEETRTVEIDLTMTADSGQTSVIGTALVRLPD
ncbi:MAG: MaoC family dehydratase [Acidimicrobiales bacterium]